MPMRESQVDNSSLGENLHQRVLLIIRHTTAFGFGYM